MTLEMIGLGCMAANSLLLTVICCCCKSKEELEEENEEIEERIYHILSEDEFPVFLSKSGCDRIGKDSCGI